MLLFLFKLLLLFWNGYYIDKEEAPEVQIQKIQERKKPASHNTHKGPKQERQEKLSLTGHYDKSLHSFWISIKRILLQKEANKKTILYKIYEYMHIWVYVFSDWLFTLYVSFMLEDNCPNWLSSDINHVTSNEKINAYIKIVEL